MKSDTVLTLVTCSVINALQTFTSLCIAIASGIRINVIITNTLLTWYPD